MKTSFNKDIQDIQDIQDKTLNLEKRT